MGEICVPQNEIKQENQDPNGNQEAIKSMFLSAIKSNPVLAQFRKKKKIKKNYILNAIPVLVKKTR